MTSAQREQGQALLEQLRDRYGGEIEYPYLKGCIVAGQACDLYIAAAGNIGAQTKAEGYSWRELMKFVRMDLGLPDPRREAANQNGPVDLWANRSSPALPPDLLPEQISDFADIMADTMGVDNGGLAMAALTVCAAVIPDSIKIQPKEHDASWQESARIWTAEIGLPSTKKSPLVAAAARPLKALDRGLYDTFAEAKERYDALDPKDRKAADKPRHTRLRLEDTTTEAAQEVLKDSPDGLLLIQDELSGWFGAMDKYGGGGRGSQKDRAFWLQSFNGGSYTVNRVGRGASFIPNLSVCLLGGIQPELIRSIARDTHDDGLLQRLFPIVLRPAKLGKDVPMPDVSKAYEALVVKCHQLRKPIRGGMQETPVRFSAAAQRVWEEVTRRNFELAASWETVNVKLAAHIGKYDGLFARLCLLWHCIEAKGDRPASVISEDVVVRVRDFLFRYLYPHAVAFYTDVIGLSDRQDKVLAVAGWILTHRPASVTIRAVRRGDRIMRGMDNEEAEAVLHQLDAFGWLDPVLTTRRDSKEWKVDSRVYDLFDERAEEEAERRSAIREIIAGNDGLRAA
ncbi:DUF3987 domain-containing protein [Mesorhizobium sp. M3A.F.Ca.ET.174.01.1.1]|uniref:DUF3987 domain-containing protein n=1 Tax=unclassified Mesorhizobium TaxID=325217 RepID=UPI0010939583|nr:MULTISPECIES: DUF3987 domain-containing protein [unclassified Mesorhizobium]TGS89404.1 DUF3987 domain-containing protein [Mesorhizobium sp. M3A.F.Ca.ET.175.01.1.1]TGT31177.1 DUF3987 domain-containing protein [Mesorhizobium sp. M3A.F.Ca.ET.174.01.1.1]